MTRAKKLLEAFKWNPDWGKEANDPMGKLTPDIKKYFMNKFKIDVADPVIHAYIDSYWDEDDKSMPLKEKEFYDTRNLDFRDKRWLDAVQWTKIMMQAVPHGYNEFDAMRVGNIFTKTYPNLKYQCAREGSVCVYVTGFKDVQQVKEFCIDMSNKGHADEIGNDRIGWDIDSWREKEIKPEQVKEIRVWWD